MDEQALRKAVEELAVPEIRYFPSIGSTNSAALEWAKQGAPENSLVIAEAQTEGRGRMDRRWITIPGSSLAFSLILYPTHKEAKNLPLFSALGALAICLTLINDYKSVESQIKWPNDVLINRRKVAGILAETDFMGSEIESTIIGFGINISRESIPPAADLLFPATSIETGLGKSVNRIDFLVKSIRCFLEWRKRLQTPQFLETWNSLLAFQNEWVTIDQGQWSLTGKPLHIDSNGNLHLATRDGSKVSINYGDVSLRPFTDKQSPQELNHV